MSSSVAVVTGAAQGIGRAIAEGLARDGEHVALLDRDGEALARTAAEMPAGTRFYECDVTDFDRLTAVADLIKEQLGQPRVLVLNAGIPQNSLFLDTSLQEQARLIEVNLVGCLKTTRAFLPLLQSTSNARIVFISSDAGRSGVSHQSIYAATKAGLIGFAKSLTLEVIRYGVTVNVVSPGTTDTPLLRNLYSQEAVDKRLRAHPAHRFATPADVADAVRYFADSATSFVTGQVISVNGGMLRAG